MEASKSWIGFPSRYEGAREIFTPGLALTKLVPNDQPSLSFVVSNVTTTCVSWVFPSRSWFCVGFTPLGTTLPFAVFSLARIRTVGTTDLSSGRVDNSMKLCRALCSAAVISVPCLSFKYYLFLRYQFRKEKTRKYRITGFYDDISSSDYCYQHLSYYFDG